MMMLAHDKKAFLFLFFLNPSFFPMARTCTIPNFFLSRPKYLPPQKKKERKVAKTKARRNLTLASPSPLENVHCRALRIARYKFVSFFVFWCAHPRTLACPPLFFRVFVVLFIRSITAIIICEDQGKNRSDTCSRSESVCTVKKN
jgi:hypothetical protein